MKPQVTLKKLADMLSLSIATVSRALKDHPDISKETKLKVKELASLLEYEPNTYAINLRTNNSKEFGVIVPAISNYFYHSFISSLEEEARRYGFSLVILQSVDDPLVELENIKRYKTNRVAGIFACITSKTTDISAFIKLSDQNIPVIFFDKVPAYEACNKVCVADTAAATMAAEALLLRNKKMVLSIFGDINMSITQKRLEAFSDAFQRYPLETTYIIKHANSSEEAFEVTYKAFTGKQKPDSIFCMSDEILTGVMKAIQKLQIKVPHEVGVIAISDGFIPRLYYPEITYIETSGFKLAKLAFNRMLTYMAGSIYVQVLVADAILVNGGSL